MSSGQLWLVLADLAGLGKRGIQLIDVAHIGGLV